MNIIWKGNIFNPTGIASAGREYCKALLKLGHKVQATDVWTSKYRFNYGLEVLNSPIDASKADATVFFDYPNNFREGHGILLGGSVHEGTRLWEGWADYLNKTDVVWCPSKATQNLFKWNGVTKPIKVIPHGVDINLYKPTENKEKTDDIFLFFYVTNWEGYEGDRKGTDLLIRAFDEEFKNEENVRLLLKISAFWANKYDVALSVYKLLGHINEKIMFNQNYCEEEEIASYYQKSDCFVAPTRCEGFGLTILNALASGLPVIVTKDNNSGHMDFCRNNPAVTWIDAPNMKQADPRFFTAGNMFAEPDIQSLRKAMRYVYEHRDDEVFKQKVKEGCKIIRENWTWENAAKKMIETIKEVKNARDKR